MEPGVGAAGIALLEHTSPSARSGGRSWETCSPKDCRRTEGHLYRADGRVGGSGLMAALLSKGNERYSWLWRPAGALNPAVPAVDASVLPGGEAEVGSLLPPS